MTNKTIYIGCDNAGFALKEAVLSVIRDLSLNYVDIGVNSASDGTYYPLIAEKLCKAMQASETPAQGILLCGTGIGMAMYLRCCLPRQLFGRARPPVERRQRAVHGCPRHRQRAGQKDCP